MFGVGVVVVVVVVVVDFVVVAVAAACGLLCVRPGRSLLKFVCGMNGPHTKRGAKQKRDWYVKERRGDPLFLGAQLVCCTRQ